MQLIAKTLHVPPRAVVVSAGMTSRIKRVAISGDGPPLVAALEKISK